jgi:glycosyltransferase involved in cell wall biosynthesis
MRVTRGGDGACVRTVVGIPARNERATIASVAAAADAGLAEAGGDNLLVLADNGSTDRTPEAFLGAGTATRQRVIHTGSLHTGKGTNLIALVQAAVEHDADRLILLDADVRSAEPAWIGRLAHAVDDAGPTLAAPTYRRNRYEASTTNHLAGPLVAALFGMPLQQPIGGEFALNRPLLARVAEWPRPASAEFYGIDIWLTANTLREGHRIREVPLGTKLHNSPFPKILRLPHQVLDSLFHVTLRLGRPQPSTLDVPLRRREAVDNRSVRQDPVLVDHVADTVRGYLDSHSPEVHALFPNAAALPPARWGLRIGTQDWPHLLADGLEGLAAGHFAAARDHLIALYVNRVLSFWEEIDGLCGVEVDALLDRQANDTAKAVADRNLVFDGVTASPTYDRGHWTGID